MENTDERLELILARMEKKEKYIKRFWLICGGIVLAFILTLVGRNLLINYSPAYNATLDKRAFLEMKSRIETYPGRSLHFIDWRETKPDGWLLHPYLIDECGFTGPIEVFYQGSLWLEHKNEPNRESKTLYSIIFDSSSQRINTDDGINFYVTIHSNQPRRFAFTCPQLEDFIRRQVLTS
ncbi:MAG: hypothetical protein FWD16_08210 [Clostridia bacterium]|nr:hypothetical protein [Clostridia bacterium]